MTDTWPKVSLLVLGYNQEAYIADTIQGAFEQDYPNLEIILSDDCSSDGTFGIMSRMAEDYSGPHRVIATRNPNNLGIVGNVNRMMELATGEIIIKNDGDDISLPHRTRRIVEEISRSGGSVKVLVSAVTQIGLDGAELGTLRMTPGSPIGARDLIDNGTPLNVVRKSLWILGAASAWTRDIFDRFGPIDPAARVEDAVIPFRGSLLGRIAYIDEPLVLYRVGGLTTLDVGKSLGYSKMYGRRLKLNLLHAASKQAMLRDMDKMEFPDREACRALCEESIRRVEFMSSIAAMSPGRRYLTLPTSVARSVRTSNPYYAYINLKYALDFVVMRVYDWRARSQ
ncbi:glycosyltransferase [Rubellimicrobium arenae]|uniref:glycosyltransferase n=1 Tax=Rubellimicrobium arenae TaxID=2817372 RepID=UPI001B317C80|nr:glycosyltransferase [Rubellimicrobium arenae]